jgi:hypothetical protein
MAVTAETRNAIIELVVTAYNAAPGTTLLTELVEAVDGGASLADVATTLTTSSTFNGLYPTFQTTTEFANELLDNLVPSATTEARAEGVAAIEFVLNSGGTRADVILQAQTFLAGLSTEDPAFGEPASAFQNKVTVATYYTVTLERDGDIDALQNAVSGVDSTEESVTTAQNTLAGQSTGGTTTNLTDKLDTVGGTTSDDTVNGIVSATSGDITYQVADSIDLGAGDGDVLNITHISNNAASSFAGRAATGVEIINLKHIDGDATGTTQTFNVGSITGATQTWVKDGSVIGGTDDTFAIQGVSPTSVIGVANNDSDLDVSFTTTATETSGDSITLAVGGGSTGDVTINDSSDGYETVNVVTSGSKGSLSSLSAGTDFKSLVISGDQAITIGSVASYLDDDADIDASASTGAVTVAAIADSKLDVTGGSAADTLYLRTGTTSVLTGMAIKDVETLIFDVRGSSTIDADLITGASAFGGISMGSQNTSQTLTLKDIAGTSASYFFTGTGSSTSDATHSGVTLSLKDSSGESDSASISVSNLGKTDGKIDASLGALTAAGIETVSISSADYDNVTFTNATFAAAKTVNITGSGDLTITGGLNADNAETVAAGDATGDLNLGTLAITNKDSTITTGSGKDTLTNATVDASKTQTINTGDGADTVTLANLAAGSATLKLNTGAGDDVVKVTGATTTGKFELDGGADTDKLEVAANVDFTAFANVEEVIVTAASTINLGVADGYADAMEVTDVAGGTVTVNFNPTSGGSVNVKNLDLLGWTKGTDVLSVTSADSANTITLGNTDADVETVIYDGKDDFGDTINGFEVGSGNDNVDLTITAVEGAQSGTNDLVLAGNGATSASAGAAVVTSVTGAFDLGTAATTSIIAVSGTYAASTDLETALETGGTRVLTANGALAANDQFLALYSNGTDSYLAVVKTAAGVADNGNFAAADLTVTNLVTFAGTTDVSTFHANNFDLI